MECPKGYKNEMTLGHNQPQQLFRWQLTRTVSERDRVKIMVTP